MSKKSQIKPFLKWVGGKTKLLLDIEKNLPKELKKRKFNYAEPFLGGGAVFFYLVQKFNIEKAYLNDINNKLINTYKHVRDKTPELIQKLKKLETDYYGSSDKKMFFLDQRENFNATKKSVQKSATLLDDELTLEHVLPFSYRAHWANVDFKDIDAGDQAGLQPRKLNYKHDGQTLHDAYVDRIGNHTLLASSDNTSISNLDFETKKRDCFESASLNITRNMNNNDEMKNISLCSYSDWNSTSIEKRSKALANIALKIWGFNL